MAIVEGEFYRDGVDGFVCIDQTGFILRSDGIWKNVQQFKSEDGGIEYKMLTYKQPDTTKDFTGWEKVGEAFNWRDTLGDLYSSETYTRKTKKGLETDTKFTLLEQVNK